MSRKKDETRKTRFQVGKFGRLILFILLNIFNQKNSRLLFFIYLLSFNKKETN
jgi:hypothetical protein